MKDYLNKFEEAKNNGDSIPDFSKQSQYMFIREKISRGYFREVGLSKGYIEKIELEKKLYELLLKLYLFYDVQTSLEFIYDINRELLNTYGILFSWDFLKNSFPDMKNKKCYNKEAECK